MCQHLAFFCEFWEQTQILVCLVHSLLADLGLFPWPRSEHHLMEATKLPTLPLNSVSIKSTRKNQWSSVKGRSLVYLLSRGAEAEASSSMVCRKSSLFSSMKCRCISDICAMIFSRRSLAISAFLFLSALSLSLELWNDAPFS